MKKIIIFSLLNLMVLSAFSQDFDILKNDETTVIAPNDTITISSTKVNSSFSEIFYLRNNTSSNEDIKVLFEKIDLVSHSAYAFCWDQCYSNSEDGFISGVVLVDAGNISTAVLSSDYTPSGNYGTSIFKYSFICDNLQDTISFVLKFDINQSTFIDFHENAKILISPNPCKDYFKVNTDELNNITSYYLFDVLGNKLMEKKGKQNNYFETSKLSNGLYFLKINYADNKHEIYRVIVNH